MDAIAKHLNMALATDKMELLKAVARDYGLDADELIDKYISNAETVGMRKCCQKKKRNDYVETEEYEYQGVTYLVDSRNQVYTYNLEKPMMIGERLVDGSVKFFEAYINSKQQSHSHPQPQLPCA